MTDAIAVAMVLLIGAAVAARICVGLTRAERHLVWLAWAFHMACAAALIMVSEGMYAGGDATGYGYVGGLLAGILWDHPIRYLPEVLALAFHQEPVVPVHVFGVGSSTGTMCAIAGLVMAVLGGSFQAASAALALFAFVAKVAMYRTLRDLFALELRLRVLSACALIPTVVFWSAGIVKESIAVSGLCLLVACARWIEAGRLARGLVWAVFATMLVGLVKPYTLFAFVMGIGAWVYARRAIARTGRLTVRPGYAIVTAIGAVIGVVVLGRVFPEFAVDTLAEELATRQEVWEQTVGGSGYQLVDAPTRTLAGQIGYAPAALFSALFRPVVFEVRNGLMAVNAAETTTVAFLFLRPAFRRGPRSWWTAIATQPFLAFCVVFTCMFGIGVGLATANLGTLSRYRMPLLPFFTMFALAADSATRRVVALKPLQPKGLRR